MSDYHIYTPENLLTQIQTAPFRLGYYSLQFYVDENGVLTKEPTNTLGNFFLSPSGGTLRDEELNIVLYSAKFDKFKGYGKSE